MSRDAVNTDILLDYNLAIFYLLPTLRKERNLPLPKYYSSKPAQCSKIHLKIGVAQTPYCYYGYKKENLNYIFLGCMKHRIYKDVMLFKLRRVKKLFPTDIVTLLSSHNKIIYYILLKFLQNIKLEI